MAHARRNNLNGSIDRIAETLLNRQQKNAEARAGVAQLNDCSNFVISGEQPMTVKQELSSTLADLPNAPANAAVQQKTILTASSLKELFDQSLNSAQKNNTDLTPSPKAQDDETIAIRKSTRPRKATSRLIEAEEDRILFALSAKAEPTIPKTKSPKKSKKPRAEFSEDVIKQTKENETILALLANGHNFVENNMSLNQDVASTSFNNSNVANSGHTSSPAPCMEIFDNIQNILPPIDDAQPLPSTSADVIINASTRKFQQPMPSDIEDVKEFKASPSEKKLKAKAVRSIVLHEQGEIQILPQHLSDASNNELLEFEFAQIFTRLLCYNPRRRTAYFNGEGSFAIFKCTKIILGKLFAAVFQLYSHSPQISSEFPGRQIDYELLSTFVADNDSFHILRDVFPKLDDASNIIENERTLIYSENSETPVLPMTDGEKDQLMMLYMEQDRLEAELDEASEEKDDTISESLNIASEVDTDLICEVPSPAAFEEAVDESV